MMVCLRIDPVANKEKWSLCKEEQRNRYNHCRNKRIYLTFLGAIVLSVMCMLRIPFLVVQLVNDTNNDGSLLTVRNLLLFVCCYLALGIIPSVMALRGFSKNKPNWILFCGRIAQFMYSNIPFYIVYELIQSQSDFFLNLVQNKSRDNCSSNEEIIERIREITTIHINELWEVPWYVTCLPPLDLVVVLPPLVICVILIFYLMFGVSFAEVEQYVLEVLHVAARLPRYQKDAPKKKELTKKIIT